MPVSWPVRQKDNGDKDGRKAKEEMNEKEKNSQAPEMPRQEQNLFH